MTEDRVEVIIYDVGSSFQEDHDAEETARVTIEGEVKGETSMAWSLRERLARDPRLERYEDGRELLRYIAQSYTTGYNMVGYNSEEARHIVEEMSDEEYQEWRERNNQNTSLNLEDRTLESIE